jgi:hypothetical protein
MGSQVFNGIIHLLPATHHHGHAQSAGAWPWSIFQSYVQAGDYASDWGSVGPGIGEIMGGE